ncbi:Glyoxylase, beta-lactamase superfamily II [Tranquillimonas rosea]|uniref:Glyoxylase, beta-lactamase superfamily II n=1 Tax=Tranquillimonas rosea TaxID=641238 RepID=A0A1H9R6E2_9RHOB|nr:MBL fold metallo-hydrolase [Tranquillimonas rosea]SER67513.1 Glyoxylase, beta-lactamase superfamily II [Tranquillimonas rosea]
MDGNGDAAQTGIRYPFGIPPEPGAWREVAEGVVWLRLPLPMKLDHVNVYLLDDGDSWTVVDTGLDTGRTRGMWEAALASFGRPVRRVVLTHHHPDHVGLAGWFQRDHGAETLASRTAWLLARMLTLDVQERPTPETIAFWRAAGMPAEMVEDRAAERPFNFADGVAPLPLGYTRLREGGTLHTGGRDWDVRLGGGHAPAHVTLWDRAGELVIGGDQMLPSISPNLGVYATEPEADPVADWLEACGRLSAHATPKQLVLPGHKLPFTGLPTRMRQLIDNHHGALGRLRAWLAEPRTAVECFPPLFKSTIGGAEYGLALAEAMAHCLHLWHAGEASRTRRADGAWLWRAV